MDKIKEFSAVDGDGAAGKLKPVCTFCKKRKIKCDRGEPCSSCVKFHNTDCIYSEISHRRRRKDKVGKPKTKTLELEIAFLRMKIDTLEKNVVEPFAAAPAEGHISTGYEAGALRWGNHFGDLLRLIEIHNCDVEFSMFSTPPAVFGEEPVLTRHYGVLSWKGCYSIDPALKTLFLATKEIKKAMFADSDDDPNIQKVRKLGDNSEPYSMDAFNLPMDAGDQPFQIKFSKLFQRDISFPRDSSKYHDSEMLRLKIKDFLPPVKILWKLVDLFFVKLYSFIPIIDEEEFKENIERIIGDIDEKGKAKELRITNKSDFAHLGILLFVLRLSYLSIMSTFDTSLGKLDIGTPPEERMAYEVLAKYPINLDAIQLAQRCLHQFNLFATINFTIFQLLMSARMYLIYGPENGDGPDNGDAQLLNALLFQLAYGLGLHRDPDLVDAARCPKRKNLMRKMWYLLLMVDVNHSLEYGDPLNANKYSYDTKLPTYSEEGSNVHCLKIEKRAVESFQYLSNSYKPVTDFLNDILDLKKTNRITELCKKLRYIGFRLFDKAYAPSQYIDEFKETMEAGGHVNLLKYKFQFQFSYFMCSLYFHLFNYFEKIQQHEVAFHFLVALFRKLSMVFFPFYNYLQNIKTRDPAIDFVLVPGVQSMLHKSNIFFLAIMVRIKVKNLAMINDPNHRTLMETTEEYREHFNKLQVLLSKLLEIGGVFNTISKAYSKKYFYAWMISRYSDRMLEAIRNEDFQKESKMKILKFPILNDKNNVYTLIDLFSRCLDKQGQPAGEENNNPSVNNFSGANSDFMETPKTSGSQTYENGSSTESSDRVDNLWMNLIDGNVDLNYDIPQMSYFSEYLGPDGMASSLDNIVLPNGTPGAIPNPEIATNFPSFANTYGFDEMLRDQK